MDSGRLGQTVVFVVLAIGIMYFIGLSANKIADSIEAGRGVDTVKVDVPGPFRDVVHYVLLTGCDTIAIIPPKMRRYDVHLNERVRTWRQFYGCGGYIIDSTYCQGQKFLDIWEVWY
jgi:hypothetical protein